MELNRTAINVLKKRYLLPGETSIDLFHRVANCIFPDDKEDRENAFDIMHNLRFLPNSPTLMNAGKENGQLSACFVLPVHDSMDNIFSTLKDAALIHKSGGGTGFDFSELRQKGAMVGSTHGVSSGPVSFMRVYDAATESIKQGGTRRGANMGVLSVHHPDIEEFIRCKSDLNSLNNFNISVSVTDRFMDAVAENRDYEIIDPVTDNLLSWVPARKIFNLLAEEAWRTGEPGIIFIDTVNRYTLHPYEKITATNPCGETPLLPYESCNLGSIDISKYNEWAMRVMLPKDVKLAVRFLNNVIDKNHYPLEVIEKATKKYRKIGLGIMGLADFLISRGLRYDSEDALDKAKEVMFDIRHAAGEQSAVFGAPLTTKSMLNNATLTTVAPTGTLSIIAGCSSGIEPLYGVAFKRTILDGSTFIEVNKQFEKIARDRGFYSDKLIEEICESGSIQHIKAIPEAVRNLFVVAKDISPWWHIKMQAAVQSWTDNAVSKTINMPSSATVENVKNAFTTAHQLGCKGITIYRDGSRENQVLSNTKATPVVIETKDYSAKTKRPEVLDGSTKAIRTSEGKFYITINSLPDGSPFEVFSTPNSKGKEAAVSAEAICRLVSLALRHGIDTKFIAQQLEKVRNQSLLSLPHNIAKCLSREKEKQEVPSEKYDPNELPILRIPCPGCGLALPPTNGGCTTCPSCGWSKCG